MTEIVVKSPDKILGIKKCDLIKIAAEFVEEGFDTVKPYGHQSWSWSSRNGCITEKFFRELQETWPDIGYDTYGNETTLYENVGYLVDHVVRNGKKIPVQSPYRGVKPKQLSEEETKELEKKLTKGHPFDDPDEGGGIEKITPTSWIHIGGYQWALIIRPTRNVNGAGEWTDYDTSHTQVTSPWATLYAPYGVIPWHPPNT